MRRTGRPLLIALVLTLGAAILAACGSSGGSATSPGNAPASSPGNAPVSIRLAANTNATVLPVWVAIDQGMFTKNGVDVMYTKVGNIDTLPPALGKSFDIVLSTPASLINAATNGLSVTWVSGSSINVGDQTNTRLLASAKSGIKQVSDLKGKTIGVLTEAGTANIATMYWLKDEGVPLDSVKIIQVNAPAMADQLAAGRVDAVEAVHPYAQSIINAGAVNLGAPYAHLSPSISGIMWIAQPDWAKQHSDAIRAFTKSIGEAQEFIKSNDTAARQILQKYTDLPAAVVAKSVLPLFDTAVRPQDLTTWLDAMQQVTGFKGSPDLSKLVFTPSS